MPYLIRPARVDDAGELLAIYAPFVTDTTVSFETEVPSVEEFRARIERGLSSFAYLVAVDEQTGSIAGYAYYGPFRSRPAYAWSVRYRSTSQRSIGATAWAGRFSARSKRACGLKASTRASRASPRATKGPSRFTRSMGTASAAPMPPVATSSAAGSTSHGWKNASRRAMRSRSPSSNSPQAANRTRAAPPTVRKVGAGAQTAPGFRPFPCGNQGS